MNIARRNSLLIKFITIPCSLQSIPEELGDSNNPGESGGTAFLPVQQSTSEGELKLHLSDDEDDDEEDDEEIDFENNCEKALEDEEAEEEEEGGQDPAEQEEPQQEVDEDQEQVQGEEAGEQEAEGDVTPAPVPEQEDPEAVALKKRT